MPYTLTWYAVGEVLQLELTGTLTLSEMQHISERITGILSASKEKLVLLIDVSTLTAGYTTADQLRTTQRYIDHPKLDALVVVASSKLNRLITLLAFNLARAPFLQYANKESAYAYIIRRGFSESSAAIFIQ